MRSLEEIIDEFNDNRESFKNFRRLGNVNKESLIEYEARFVDLRADLRPYRKDAARAWQQRDDKSATAIKGRLTIAIHRGELLDDEGDLIYPKCSINQAEKFASGSERYRMFISQRADRKENLVNLTDLRGDMDGYINLIKDMLKALC